MNAFNRFVAFYDRNIVRFNGWERVPGSELGFLYMVPKSYRGKPVTIDDGTVISKGDKYYEIHIVNTNLMNLDTGYGNLFIMLKDELELIGEHMKKEGFGDYKAVLAVTLLHRLARRAGFTIKEIDHPVKRRLVSLGENILRSALRKERNTKDGKKRVAKECWISREQIFEIRNME